MSTLEVRRSVSTILFNQPHWLGRCEAAVGSPAAPQTTFSTLPAFRLSSGKQRLHGSQRGPNAGIMGSSCLLPCAETINHRRERTGWYIRPGLTHRWPLSLLLTHTWRSQRGRFCPQKNKPCWVMSFVFFQYTQKEGEKNTSCCKKSIKVQMTQFYSADDVMMWQDFLRLWWCILAGSL